MSEKQEGLVFRKVAAALAAVQPIAKSQRNNSQGYNFRGVDDVYNAVQPILAEQGLFSSMEILDLQHDVKEAGPKTIVRTVIRARVWFIAEDGSRVSTDVVGEGMDYGGDKASNKAMSVAHKYAILQILMIPTGKVDPESDERVGGQADKKDVEDTATAMLGSKMRQAGAKTVAQYSLLIKHYLNEDIDPAVLKEDPKKVGKLLQLMSQDKDFRNALKKLEGE